MTRLTAVRRPFPPFFSHRPAAVALAGLCAATLLAACGDDDAPSPGVASSSRAGSLSAGASARPDVFNAAALSGNMAAANAAARSTVDNVLATARTPADDLAASFNGAIATLGAAPPDSGDAAPDSPVQSALASLAADSRQVAPIIRYAPGDGPGDGGTRSN